MQHPLAQQLSRVRRKARWLLALYGLGWLIGLPLAVALALGILDYLVHFEDRGIRIICSLLVVGAIGWCAWRFLLRTLRVRLGDHQLAMRLQRRFPQLNDALASALNFLSQSEGDETAGSAALRRAVVAEASAEVQQLELSDSIDNRPTRRVLTAAGVVLAIVMLLFLVDFRSASIALARLSNPFGKVAWPQRTHLQFREIVRRAPAGGVFEVTVIDAYGAKLPDDVKIHIRYEGARPQSEALREAKGSLAYRQESVNRPFSYRATGGDDRSMEWVPLEVIEPPALESLAIKVHPPEYTQWPVASSEKNIKALRGTRVELAGTATKRLKSAAVVLEDGTALPATVSADGFGFALSPEERWLTVGKKSTSYRLKLVDLENFSNDNDPTYEIRSVPDLPPSVIMEEPGPSIFVTAQAEVPLKLLVKDDLAIRDVELRYSRSDESDKGETAIVIHQGPLKARPQPGGISADEGESLTLEHRWDLAPLKLPSGAQVTFLAASTDYVPQAGQSTARRLFVITRDELVDRLAERQTLILGEIAKALESQRLSRGLVRDVQIDLRDKGTLDKPGLDRIQGADLSQGQVNRTLTSPEEGIPSQVRQLLADLSNNKVDSPEIGRRMEDLLDLLGRLEREQLGGIRSDLTSAMKEAQAAMDKAGGKSPPPGSEDVARVGQAVASAAARQDEVIAALEGVLGEMTQWDSYRRFFRDVNTLRKEHDDVAAETSRIAQKTLSKSTQQLDRGEQAGLNRAAERQAELARQFDLIQQRMEKMGQELQADDPLAADVLQDALHAARQSGLSGQMRDAAGQIRKNQMSQASQAQQKAGEGLRDVLDVLANRREHELSRLVKKLRQAEQDLAGLRQEQQRLNKQMHDAEQNQNEQERKRELERLTREQQKLKEEAERQARQLQRLQQQKAGGKLAGAAQRMSQAEQNASQGDAGGAQQEGEQAQKDLEEAQQELAEARQQAEADLAFEELARLADALQGLLGRQQTVVDEIQRLEGIREKENKFTRGQLLSLRDLAAQESALHDETIDFAGKLEAAKVFAKALALAARDLETAGALLDQQETGEPSQRAAKNALRQFQQLAEALKPDPQENQAAQQGEEGPSGGQGAGQGMPADGVTMLAELKMLRLMQEDVYTRTQQLEDAVKRGGEITDQQKQELDELTQQQGELAKLLMDLSQQAQKEKPADDPENLPELKLEEKPKAPANKAPAKEGIEP